MVSISFTLLVIIQAERCWRIEMQKAGIIEEKREKWTIDLAKLEILVDSLGGNNFTGKESQLVSMWTSIYLIPSLC